MEDLKSTTLSRLSRYNSNKDITIHNKDIYTISFLNNDEEYVIFSYLYSDIYTDEIDFISIGNNILSKDGSYMSNFFKSSYINLFNNKIVEKVLSILAKKIHDFKLKIRYELVYGHIYDNKILQTNLLCLKIFSIYLILTYIFKKQSRIFTYEFINELFDDYDIIKELKNTNLSIKDINTNFNILGQKIIPKGFYYKDNNLIKSKEYKYESPVLYALSKEVFKKRTPAFSILIGSEEMSEVSDTIFDNNNIKINLENSKQIVNEKKNKLIDLYSNKINIFILEDCGLSLHLYVQNRGNLLGNIFRNKNALASVIFQLCHSVYILNNLGFAHGDTHFANITVRETNKWFNISNDKIKDSYSIFKTRDANYFVRFYGAYLTLLDMSRIIDINYVEGNKKEVIYKINKICEYSIKSRDSVKLLLAYNACDIVKMLLNIDIIINSEEYHNDDNINYLSDCIHIIKKYIKKIDNDDIKKERIKSKDINDLLSNSSMQIINLLFSEFELDKMSNSLDKYSLVDEFSI